VKLVVSGSVNSTGLFAGSQYGNGIQFMRLVEASTGVVCAGDSGEERLELPVREPGRGDELNFSAG